MRSVRPSHGPVPARARCAVLHINVNVSMVANLTNLDDVRAQIAAVVGVDVNNVVLRYTVPTAADPDVSVFGFTIVGASAADVAKLSGAVDAGELSYASSVRGSTVDAAPVPSDGLSTMWLIVIAAAGSVVLAAVIALCCVLYGRKRHAAGTKVQPMTPGGMVKPMHAHEPQMFTPGGAASPPPGQGLVPVAPSPVAFGGAMDDQVDPVSAFVASAAGTQHIPAPSLLESAAYSKGRAPHVLPPLATPVTSPTANPGSGSGAGGAAGHKTALPAVQGVRGTPASAQLAPSVNVAPAAGSASVQFGKPDEAAKPDEEQP